MRIRRFATLSRNARALACVGTRLSSPKVRHYPRQRSCGSLLASWFKYPPALTRVPRDATAIVLIFFSCDVTAAGPPMAQRRFRYAEIMRNTLDTPPICLDQPQRAARHLHGGSISICIQGTRVRWCCRTPANEWPGAGTRAMLETNETGRTLRNCARSIGLSAPG